MKCRHCDIEKNEEEFYKGHKVCKKCRVKKIKEWKKNNPDKVSQSQKKRRLENYDKKIEYEREYRKLNKEKINQISKKFRESNEELCKKRCLQSYHKRPWVNKEWRKENIKKCREYAKKYREKNREECNKRNGERNRKNQIHKTIQGKARKAVYTAIKNGILIRMEKCQLCNKECKTHAHHGDYKKPLEVIWVCTLCHGGIHRTLRSKDMENERM